MFSVYFDEQTRSFAVTTDEKNKKWKKTAMIGAGVAATAAGLYLGRKGFKRPTALTQPSMKSVTSNGSAFENVFNKTLTSKSGASYTPDQRQAKWLRAWSTQGKKKGLSGAALDKYVADMKAAKEAGKMFSLRG